MKGGYFFELTKISVARAFSFCIDCILVLYVKAVSSACGKHSSQANHKEEKYPDTQSQPFPLTQVI